MAPSKSVSKSRINFDVSTQTKEEWKLLVSNDNRYGSLSALCRAAVTRELAGLHDSEEDARGVDEDTIEAFEERFDAFEATLDTFGDELKDIELTVPERYEVQDAEPHAGLDMPAILFQLLPVNPEEGVGTTPSELARIYGFDENVTKNALNELVAQFGVVVREEADVWDEDDTLRTVTTYYREGEN